MYQPVAMSTEQIKQCAPSVFTDHASVEASKQYRFLSTETVLDAVQQEYGLEVYRAGQSSSRTIGGMYVKHNLRLRQAGQNNLTIVGDAAPEVSITNSHDTGSSFIVELGLFRLVCSNGMVVSDGAMQACRVRHVGVTIEDVLAATDKVLSQFSAISDRVNLWKSTILTEAQRYELAQRAIGLRWDATKLPFPPENLLTIRRTADQGRDLWHTFNVVQENLIKGQRMYRRYYGGGTLSGTPTRSTRSVESINTDLEINRGLWSLASEYATA